MPATSDRSGSSERQLVVFTLHAEQYGVPIEMVREIVHYTRPMATAAATGLVRGLISLRGEVLPVADLSPRLHHDPHSGENAQIVVLALDGGSLGLIVDRVDGVRHVPQDRVSASPVPGTEPGLGDEIAAIDDTLVLLIDPQRVLGDVLRPPRTTQSRATKPRTAKPRAAKPRPEKPSAAKPRATKPTAAKPRATKPPAAKPPATKPPRRSTRRPPPS